MLRADEQQRKAPASRMKINEKLEPFKARLYFLQK